MMSRAQVPPYVQKSMHGGLAEKRIDIEIDKSSGIF
jgi:hypothetical protein